MSMQCRWVMYFCFTIPSTIFDHSLHVSLGFCCALWWRLFLKINKRIKHILSHATKINIHVNNWQFDCWILSIYGDVNIVGNGILCSGVGKEIFNDCIIFYSKKICGSWKGDKIPYSEYPQMLYWTKSGKDHWSICIVVYFCPLHAR